MATKRKNYNANEKAKIALEAIKGHQTIAQLTAKYSVHATQINSWKKQLLASLPDVFLDKRNKDEREKKQLIDELYQ